MKILGDEINSSEELQLQLEHSVKDLEKFSELLSKFVAWWNEMEMESNTQLTRESMVIKKFDPLRLKSIESRWKDHRKRYAAYVDEVSYSIQNLKSKKVIEKYSDWQDTGPVSRRFLQGWLQTGSLAVQPP